MPFKYCRTWCHKPALSTGISACSLCCMEPCNGTYLVVTSVTLSLWEMQSLGQHDPRSVVGVCLSFLRPRFQSRLSHGLGQSCGQEWVGVAMLKKQFISLGLCTVRAQSCCPWRFCSCYCSIGRLQIQFTLQELQSGRNVWLGHPAVISMLAEKLAKSHLTTSREGEPVVE